MATVLFFALWVVALKPSSSSSSGGLGQYQGAINSAHAAVGLANQTSAAQGGTIASSTPAPASTHAAATTPATPAATAATSPATKAAAASATATKPAGKTATTATTPSFTGTPRTTAGRVQTVLSALRAHKVLALVFYNPAAPDDNAVARELRTIPAAHGRVVPLAVPISELSNYAAVTSQIAVTVSPTLVFVDRSHQASTIVGYASRFEIAQRVADALAVPPVAH
ncbi:MAG: hypothetical protein ACYDHH_06485 [Solirubrobacteraceae bacterium]